MVMSTGSSPGSFYIKIFLGDGITKKKEGKEEGKEIRSK